MRTISLNTSTCRKLAGIGVAVFLPLTLSIVLLSIAQANAQDKKEDKKGDKQLVVEITTEKQLKVLKEELKGVDPKTYRFTVIEMDGKKARTSTLGSLPLEQAELAHKQVKSIHPDKRTSYVHSTITYHNLTLTDFYSQRIMRLEEAIKKIDGKAEFQVKRVENTSK